MTEKLAAKRSDAHAPHSDGARGSAIPLGRAAPLLRSCEVELIGRIRGDWVVAFGSREVRLIIEYQDGVPVLIRVMENTVKEEKLK